MNEDKSHLNKEDADEIIRLIQRMIYELPRNWFTYMKFQERLYKTIDKLSKVQS